jgi:2,3-bisphosphoglycerate-dependent phosphoglycerate mutase
MDAPTLFLVRHGEAAGQEPGAPLTDRGIAAVHRLAPYLEAHQIDVLVSSPYRRAQDTARLLGPALRLPVWLDRRLAERVLTSQPSPEWRSLLAATFADPDLTYPGGESSRGATRRALAVVTEVVRQGYRRPLLVTHGNLLALVLHHFRSEWGFPEWERLAAPDAFSVAPIASGWRVTRLQPE